MIFGVNTTRDISKLSQITYNNFEISLVVFMPNITTNHAITYTNKALSCLVLSCLVYQSGCIGTVRGTKYKKKKIYWRPYDPTTYICRRPWNRRWKKDFATFQTESLLSQVAQFLKRRKFKLKLTEERGPRTNSDRDRGSLSPCRFSSQVNLEFLI